MAGEGTPASTTSGATKELTLLARDLAMFTSAGSYDLSVAKEKRRSVDELARFFYDVAKALEIDLFIEAGAKDAGSSRRARRRLDTKRIVAFEANPYTHKTYDAKYDNAAVAVEYLHLALSDAPGTVTFNVNQTPDGKPIVDGQGSLLKHQFRPDGFIEVSVEATTLDTFFADHEYESCGMWVDVEGALEGVFTGGAKTLDKASVVIVEIEDRSMWGSGQWMRTDVASYLYDHGLVPVARDFQSRYQYNIVFIRQTLLDSVDRVRWILANHLSAAASGRPGVGSARRPAPPSDATMATSDAPAKARQQTSGPPNSDGAPPLRRLVPKPIRDALHPAYKAVRSAAGR